MTTFAIGDIHGCFRTLCRLLRRLHLDPRHDRLWLVGDLVNRGPRSLDVLRWAREYGPRLTMVLGNHDLHLLARAEGVREPRPRDTLDDVLEAPDRDELLAWLARQPLIHRDGRYVLVHAGLLPSWSIEHAEALAREAEKALTSPRRAEVLAAYSDDEEGEWSDDLRGLERLERIAGVVTRLRVCTPDGQPLPRFSDAPENAPAGCEPWYALRPESDDGATIIFGHWAALGLYRQPSLLGLDGGCVWGGQLCAARLDDGKVFREPCAESRL